MAKPQPTYTKEFKQEAVKLIETSNKSKSAIARDFGISDSALSKWCKEFVNAGEQAFPGKGHQTALEEEIRRLQRENEILRQERDILKKRCASSCSPSSEIRVYCRASARISSYPPVPGASCFGKRVLCLAQKRTKCKKTCR